MVAYLRQDLRRARRSFTKIDTLLHNLRYTVRSLRRTARVDPVVALRTE